ncbi:MAG TPA: DUF2304 domain-containing protein [Acidimicrobiales bacterium]|nr:DUF2304 domain-containing protein [Acidimicrobiales bacterium]
MTTQAHVFVVVVTLLAVAFVIRLVRRRQLRAKYAMLWVAVCAVIAFMAAVPSVPNRLARGVGIFYQPAAFLFAAVVFLFLVVVHFSYELSRLEERSQVLAQEVALLRRALEERRAEDDGVSAPPGT